MHNVSWFALLLSSTLAYLSPHGLALAFPVRECKPAQPIIIEISGGLGDGYCHGVFETKMLPYFAQFPVVEIDRGTADFWSSFLYRSAFARYGDQWDWEARRSFAAYWAGVRNGWIVPKSRFVTIRASNRAMESRDLSNVSPKPVRILNPFCAEGARSEADQGKDSHSALEAGTLVRTTTSSGIMPLRIVNQFVP
ncbi:MAG: hypothetical protein ACUVQG_06290 [Thermogutta sp.]